VTFAELITSTSWAEVKAALSWLFPGERGNLAVYRKIFHELQRIKSEASEMRIAIECRPVAGDEPRPEVVGRNGMLNRDLDDFKHLGKQATAEYGAEEVVWSLSLRPWRSWLGMTVEPGTLATHSAAHVIAHCLDDMTFYGFSEADVREFRDELDKRMAEIEEMSEEERSGRPGG
jgi:hypothetical protein